MAYKDPKKQAEYQREYQRMKRSGESGTPRTAGKTLNPEDAQTAKGLLDLLSTVIAEVRAEPGDTFIKARLTAYLISIGLKCVETAELERRITELERTLKEGEST